MVLDDSGDDHIGGMELQPIREMVDRLRRVATEDGDVRPIGIPSCEGENGAPGTLIGRCRTARSEAGSTVHARVPGQELGDPPGRIGMCLGRRSLVELDCGPIDAVDAGNDLS